jgi:hypothetical protein
MFGGRESAAGASLPAIAARPNINAQAIQRLSAAGDPGCKELAAGFITH